jgi:hypothetical protein
MKLLCVANSYTQFVENIKNVFNKYNIEYMLLGGGAAILQGFNYTTEDIDIYPEKSKSNCEKIVLALQELGFELNDEQTKELLQGKDFVQFDDPFEVDFVFSPDGFNSYKEAKKYKKYIEDYPVLSIDGIILSKKAANRKKDLLILPFLIDFNIFLKSKKIYENTINYFNIIEDYEYADEQTLVRWTKNLNRSLVERLNKGIR